MLCSSDTLWETHTETEWYKLHTAVGINSTSLPGDLCPGWWSSYIPAEECNPNTRESQMRQEVSRNRSNQLPSVRLILLVKDPGRLVEVWCGGSLFAHICSFVFSFFYNLETTLQCWTFNMYSSFWEETKFVTLWLMKNWKSQFQRCSNLTKFLAVNSVEAINHLINCYVSTKFRFFLKKEKINTIMLKLKFITPELKSP